MNGTWRFGLFLFVLALRNCLDFDLFLVWRDGEMERMVFGLFIVLLVAVETIRCHDG